MDLRINPKAKLRILPTPDEGMRALASRAPQAEAFAERSLERLRPSLQWFYRMRRRLATGAVAVLAVWIFVHVTFGANGMVIYRQKRSEYQGLQKETRELQKQNDRLSAQIKGLQSNPAMIEKEAREQLHYARPGEVVYVVPNAANPQAPASDTAKK